MYESDSFTLTGKIGSDEESFDLRQRPGSSCHQLRSRTRQCQVHPPGHEIINITTDSGYEDSFSSVRVDNTLWDYLLDIYSERLSRRQSFVEKQINRISTSRAVDQLVIFLLLTFLIFGISSVVLVFKTDGDSLELNEKEDESFPSLERNFLLAKDVSYEDVRKMRGDLEDQSIGAMKENLMYVNVNKEIFRENQDLMDRLAKTFSGITGKLAEDTRGRHIKQRSTVQTDHTSSVQDAENNSAETLNSNPLTRSMFQSPADEELKKGREIVSSKEND